MTEAKSPKKPPTAAEQRQARLEQELRANLQRRKSQARARRDGAVPKGDGEDGAEG